MRRQQQLVVGLALVAAISGVAAFPLLSPTKRGPAEVEPETPVDEPAEVAEVKPAPAPVKNAAPPQRRKVTRWSGGGDVVVGGSSGGSATPGTSPQAPGRANSAGTRLAGGSAGGGRSNPNQKVRVQWRETEVRNNGDGTSSINSQVKEKVMTRAEADKFIADMKGRNETEARRSR